MLALPNTSVIAAARPTDDFDGLDKLQDEFKDRLLVVKMELLDADTVQASQCESVVISLHNRCVGY